MRDVYTYHLYIQAKKELEKLFNESGLDAQGCFNILEPEMAHGFNAIRVFAEELKNNGNVYYKKHNNQSSLLNQNDMKIHNQSPGKD